METRANHLIVGAFVLGVIGAILGFFYWMRNDAIGPTARNYYVVFDGSVQGLTEASPVQFNGIRFGAVRSISLVPEDTRKVRAVISVRADTPVRTNSRARITAQGLAGYVALEITPGTPDAPLLTAKAGEDFAVIPAEPGGSGSVLSGASEVVGNANALLLRLNTLVETNEESLHRTFTNVEALSTVLKDRKDDVSAIIQDARSLSGRLNQIALKLDGAVDKLASDDPHSAVAQVQQAATSFRQLAEKLDKTLGDKAGPLTEQAERSLREFELFMKDGRRLADSLDRVVQKVERNPTQFLLGGQQTPKY